MFEKPTGNRCWYCAAALGLLLPSFSGYSAPDQSQELAVLRQQIETLHRAAKFSEELPLAEKALTVAETSFGSEHSETAKSLDELGDVYLGLSDYAKAEPLYQRALTIQEKGLGTEHPATAETLNKLGRLYTATSAYAKAESLHLRAIKIDEKALGPEHPGTATCLNNLGEVYVSMGELAKVEPLFQRALKIREKALGPEHSDTAESLNNLALLYHLRGDYAKAVPLCQRALKINEKALGPEHPNTATSLNDLASLYNEMGDYTKAEPLLQRALKIDEKALGPEHLETATDLSNLAFLYTDMGDYAKAEPLYQRALKVREKILDPEHSLTAVSLNNLGNLYDKMGDYAKAEALLQRALKIDEKALGSEHSGTATDLNNLASLYGEMGDYAKAEPLFQRAFRIREKVLGPEHPNTAASLGDLGELYYLTGSYAKAEPVLKRALKICEKALGPGHPFTARSLNNLGEFYHEMGNYAKAELLDQRALKIREKALGLEHSDTAKNLNNLARLYTQMGDPKEALRLAARARRGQEKALSNILSFTSEQQRLVFQKTAIPYTLSARSFTIGLPVLLLGDTPELAETVLRQKGVVLDSLLEDRLVAEASGDPKQRDIITEVRSAKQRLMKLLLEVPQDLSEDAHKRREAEKQALSKRVEDLESGLARQVAGLGKARRALGVTVEQAQATLGKDEALVELIRYDHYLGKNKSESRYGAIVISFSGEPKWVLLGSADDLEENIKLYQKSVRGTTDEETLRNALHSLFAQIWVPIEKSLPEGTKRIVLSPDGQLNFVSFATLLGTDDKFVAEKYSVRYVASGRDLLKETKPSNSQMMLVYANPDFGGKAVAASAAQPGAVALRSLEMRDLQGLSLPPLSGTAREAAALQKRAEKSVKVFLGSDASEAELRQVNSPRILHLATHGFFLPEMELGKSVHSREDIPKGKLVNPMHRSGLALAGAQRTLEAWNHGEVPSTENDGILTAEEVGGLKLDGTWLVVLSACDTGSGEARAGEGVMGLRRGFIQAGAQNLLMTLWPISDQTTVQLMVDFYDAADKTKNAPQALANVQRDWLVKLRKERGLLEAVRLAGPFIMSSQGKQ